MPVGVAGLARLRPQRGRALGEVERVGLVLVEAAWVGAAGAHPAMLSDVERTFDSRTVLGLVKLTPGPLGGGVAGGGVRWWGEGDIHAG